MTVSLIELADLVWPQRCAACAAPGAAWCSRCAADLKDGGFRGGPARVRPRPAPPGMPPVHAWGPYRGVVRTAVVAYKDRDRRDLQSVLAPLLASALAAAVANGTPSSAAPRTTPVGRTPRVPVLVVPVPSSAGAIRQRGDRPLERLGCRAAAAASAAMVAGATLTWAPCIRTRRGVDDQAGLDRRARGVNVAGAFVLRSRWRAAVNGASCVVVDDVVTTGATLTEAARALLAGGAGDVRCATIAATARHHEGGTRQDGSPGRRRPEPPAGGRRSRWE